MLALSVLFLSSNLLADKKPTMSLIQWLETPSLGTPYLSPDGHFAVGQVSRANWKANKRIGHLWLRDIEAGVTSQFTQGDQNDKAPVWAPDSQSIAFLSKRGEDEATQAYTISINGGEAQRLTNHPTDVSDLQWSPDGMRLYFLAKSDISSEEKEKRENRDDIVGFDEDYQQESIWRLDLANGNTVKITDGEYSVNYYKVSRDGRKIVYLREPTSLPGDDNLGEIWIMNIDGSDAARLTDNHWKEYGAELSPDNRLVIFISWMNEKFDSYHDDNLFLIDVSTGIIRMLMPDFDHDMDAAHWSADGQSIFFNANVGVKSQLFRYSLETETVERVTDGESNILNWSYSHETDSHLFTRNEPGRGGEAWMLHSDSDSRAEQLTYVYTDYEDKFPKLRQEAIRWKATDGVSVEGLLTYPLDYEKGKRYPLVVQVHGGPRHSDQYGLGRWRTYLPILAAKGYAVLWPNHRGSAGYGDAFMRDMVGGYFRHSHTDVMSGVDFLIDEGIVDPDKMAIMGWSAGGHMTNKLITYTDRFKAASSGAGAINWISMYAQSDKHYQRTDWFGGTPWEENAPIDLYWATSPLSEIWKVETPTLIFVGTEDERVPAAQSLELYRALKENGVDTHLYMAPREPHDWKELRHRLFKINAELEWFEKLLNNREYVWEAAPED